jgi:tetratricopeptide (TPR) repeat protein
VILRRERAADDPLGLSRALLAESALRREQGNFEGAIEIAHEAIRPLEAAAAAAPDDASLAAMLAVARLDMAEVLRRAGRLDEGGALADQVLTGLAQSAPGTPNHIGALHQLGRIRSAQGRLEEADRYLRRALEMQVAVADEFAEATIDGRAGLAENLVLLNRPDEALPLLRQNVEIVRRAYGERHASLGIAWNNLANALSDIPEHLAEAEQAYLTALDILSSAQGLAHPEIATLYNNLGALYIRTRHWERAADVNRRALDLRIALLGDRHPRATVKPDVLTGRRTECRSALER